MISDSTIIEAAELAASAFESSPTYREIYRPETRLPSYNNKNKKAAGQDEITADEVEAEANRLIHKDLVALFRRHFKLIADTTPEAMHFTYSDELPADAPQQQQKQEGEAVSSGAQSRVMVCFFMLIRSDAEVSFWQKLRAGLLTLLFISGRQAFTRMMAASDYFDEMKLHTFRRDAEKRGDGVQQDNSNIEQTNHASIPVHLSLNRMVVHPAFQGRSIGSRALRRALEEEADKERLPVVLSTQLERNVTFYEKLGFRTVFQDDFKMEPSEGEPDYSFTSYFMIRDPR